MKTRKKGRVPGKLTIEEAADRLNGIIEKHLSTLGKADRKARMETFHERTAKICGTPRKSEGRPDILGSPALCRGRG
jgi:hypothetical protein